MKKSFKICLFSFICIISSLVLGLGIYYIQPQNIELPPEQKTEAATSHYSNTQIAYSNIFNTRGVLPDHVRPGYGSPCQFGGYPASGSGNWRSASGFGSIMLFSGPLDTGLAENIFSFVATRGYAISSISSCPSCTYTCNQQYVYPYTIPTTLISVSHYGTYTLRVRDGDYNVQETVTFDHSYVGKLILNKNGGTGGDSSTLISSNESFLISKPTKKGYNFKGYFTSVSGGTQIFSEEGRLILLPSNFPSTMTGSTETLYARWEVINKSVTVVPGIGSYTGGNIGQSKSYYGDYGTCMQIYNADPPSPSAAYDFTGWTTDYGGDGGGGISLLHKATEFNGTASTAIALGRDKMYTDSFTVNVWAYMDNWAIGADGTRFISCTEGGGWSIYRANGQILIEIYEQNYGYVRLYSTTLAANLASGWHMFTGVFDGHKSRLYLDGKLEGTSERTFVNPVAYNPTNGIFIGAEPEGSATTPLGSYFKGKMKGVGIFNAPISESTIKSLYDNNYSSYYCFGEKHGSISANYQYYEPTVTTDPNGGLLNGSSAATQTKQPRGSTMSVSVPSRAGYNFKGWGMANYSQGAKVSNVGSLHESHTDPFLKNGNMYSVYNNSGNGNVKHERIAKPSDLPSPYNSHVLKISNIGPANPDLGGFVVEYVNSYANAEFYTVIQAKIPVGYRIEWNSNATGDGRVNKWLTSTQGTGDWETYVYYLKCGSTGRFSDTNYYYLLQNAGSASGTPTNPVTWYVASSCTYDATRMGLNPDTYVSNMSKTATYTFGNSDQTLVALWESDVWTRYTETPPQASDGYYQVSTPGQLAYFAKLTKTQHVTAKIRLMNDIDLSAHRWIPIGNGTYFFQNTAAGNGTAEFDGQGFKITGIDNFDKTAAYQGLFGWVYNRAIIKNLNVYGTIEGADNVGGLIGFGYANVQNCNNYVNVVGIGSNVGGVVGTNLSSFISKTKNFGDVYGSDLRTGGIAGYSQNYCSIVEAYNFGNVSGKTKVGGIFGEFRNGTGGGMTLVLVRCFNSGNVSGESFVGGLGGSVSQVAPTYTLSLRFETCGVNADIISKSFNADTGGMLGTLDINPATILQFTLFNCYFNGQITSLNSSFASENAFIGNGLTDFVKQKMKNSYVYAESKINTSVNLHKNYSVGTFNDFSYVKGVNNGLPVPSGLFWIGGMGGQDCLQYLKNRGFTLLI